MSLSWPRSLQHLSTRLQAFDFLLNTEIHRIHSQMLEHLGEYVKQFLILLAESPVQLVVSVTKHIVIYEPFTQKINE